MKKVVVKNATYRDSISLMKISNELQKLPGVKQAAVVMSTELNRRVLGEAGFSDAAISTAAGDDMIIAIEADDGSTLNSAFAQVDRLLTSTGEAQVGTNLPTSLEEALLSLPDADLVVISVPGPFAKRETMNALSKGLNVFLFSSNVSREDELELKQMSSGKGLLLMGPDCGTSIINHKVLGFGNYIREGFVGLVSASGTGLQEVTTLIHEAGLGVSQAIGTGGDDLSEQIGGITMTQGIALLDADSATRVIVIISKPPGTATLQKVLGIAKQCHKPVVANFLGGKIDPETSGEIFMAKTLDEAAGMVCETAGINPPYSVTGSLSKVSVSAALAERGKLANGQRFVHGLFAGGTLCYESQLILTPLVGIVQSNAPVQTNNLIPGDARTEGHTCIDMGAEEFVEGRAHPMMDFSLRNLRILREARDPSTAVVLFDVELGYGSNSDPAGQLVPVITEAREISEREGRYLSFVASIIGTEGDSQGLEKQQKALSDVGILVLPSNAQATRVAALIATGNVAVSTNAVNSHMRKTAETTQMKTSELSTTQVGSSIIGKTLKVINIGISTFADDLRSQGVEVIHVDWRPPAGGDLEMVRILERLDS